MVAYFLDKEKTKKKIVKACVLSLDFKWLIYLFILRVEQRGAAGREGRGKLALTVEVFLQENIRLAQIFICDVEFIKSSTC